MATWGEFATASPTLAARGRQLFYRTETGEALLATVRGDGLPRVHPIYVAILEDRLVAFITESPKAIDLATDGRFALHTHQDPDAPDEFQVRGRAQPIVDEATRTRFAAAWYFEASEDYRLFDFLIDRALLGERPGPDDWPPRYTAWQATEA
jgi:Pyridoxamine 5'-phosphate oxidase